MAVSISRAHIHGQPVQGEESRGLSDLSLLKLSPAAKSLQSCPTLCNPLDGSPPGSPIPGMLQERTLEWVAISFSNAWKWKMKVKSLSHVQLLATTWTAAHQAPPSMGFSRKEYWSGGAIAFSVEVVWMVTIPSIQLNALPLNNKWFLQYKL